MKITRKEYEVKDGRPFPKDKFLFIISNLGWHLIMVEETGKNATIKEVYDFIRGDSSGSIVGKKITEKERLKKLESLI